MAEVFTRTFHARWGDMDFNAHMRNTAYLDLSGDVRMLYFQERGFTMKQFQERGIGPVILRDELDYFRELRLLENVSVTMLLVGLSDGAARFKLRNEFWSDQKKLVARVTSSGGWLDLAARKLTAPPEELAAAIRGIARADDYADLTGKS